MKKMTFFVMALAMVLGFTQCKKEQVATTEIEGEKVTVTLKLDNGSRGHIEPNENTAAVVYDKGDIIMVGFNGAYVGDLTTTDGSNFSGSVDISGEPADGKIHFYYLNGKNQTVNNGKCTVDISDQTTGLPVISYASVAYRSDNTYSDVKMRNQCGLVKFNTTNVAGAITISGMNNQMEVDFTAQSFTPKNIGDVKLNGTSGTTRWAILLPQDAVDDATVIASGYNNSTCDVPSVTNNLYYTAGVSVSLTPAFLGGLFTVNADGKKVYFSKGNLQATATITAQGTSWTWAFAEHQWDKIGNATANTNITSNGTVSENGTVDLFGWSTASTYLGIHNSTNNNDYSGDFVDWGSHAHVKAVIGEGWRTLTSAEWRYLFVTRTTTSGKHYCKAQVNGMPGVILLPDDWSTSYHSLAFCDVVELSFDASNIDKVSLEDWNNHFVPHGAVFLPTTGHRYKENTTNEIEAPNGRLYYWSSTSGSNTSGTNANANQMYIAGNAVTPDTGGGRHYGNAVRLVRDAN